MIRRPPRSTPLYSSAASDVYKRQLPRTDKNPPRQRETRPARSRPELRPPFPRSASTAFSLDLPRLFPSQANPLLLSDDQFSPAPLRAEPTSSTRAERAEGAGAASQYRYAPTVK